VLHITDGQGSALRTARYFAEMADGRVGSAHYVIGQLGEIWQCVLDADVAYHAHAANDDSIGIELCARTKGERGPSDPGLPISPIQYRRLVELVRWQCALHVITASPRTVDGHAAVDPETTHTDCPTGQLDWGVFWRLYNPPRVS